MTDEEVEQKQKELGYAYRAGCSRYELGFPRPLRGHYDDVDKQLAVERGWDDAMGKALGWKNLTDIGDIGE